MTQVLQKTLNTFRSLKRSDPELYKFFEQLLFGSWGKKNSIAGQVTNYNIYTKRSSQCVMYLHQQHIQLLICIDKWMTGYRKYFNLKNIQISEMNPSYQIDQKLQKNKYLILHQKHDQIILLFDCMEKKNLFKFNLEKLKKILQKIPDLYDPFVLKAFLKADLNQNGEISWEELKSLVRMMKIDLNPQTKQMIKSILGKESVERIFFGEFQQLWKIFYCRKQLQVVFQKYNNEKFCNYDQFLTPKLDIKQFRKFLTTEQLETEQECNKIIQRLYERNDISLSFYDFCHYIFGPQNNLFSENYKNFEMDTSRPLNHYHCYSSHNTYLTGDQLFSSSRAERYLIDLQNGLRCVQIDVHDDSDGPIVKHGYTATAPVSFKEVIESVKRFTLLNPNHTPIILSIQNHCNQQNQLLMYQILTENFQQQILKVNSQLVSFPALKDCIGKIIIKGPGNYKLFEQNKKINSDVLEATQSEQQIILDNQNELIFQNPKKLPTDKTITSSKNEQKRNQNLTTTTKQGANKNQNNKKNQTKERKSTYHQKFKISGKLLRIICMLSKAKIQNIEHGHWESNSFSEQKIIKIFLDPQQKQKIKNLSNIKWFRSYPDGMRIWSSNYDPLPALQLGVQIVAINTQTKDDINHHILKAFFVKGSNKSIGYRLKNELPPSQNGQKNIKNLQSSSEKGQKIMTTVSIKFISGLRIYQNQDDFKTIPPVCIKAYFTGNQQDNFLNRNILVQQSFTEVIQKQSFCPRFTKSKPLQIKCYNPQFGFLIVEVPDCGRSVIPIDSMRHGWRVFSLYDQDLKEKQSRILCQIKISKQISKQQPIKK